MYSRLDPIFKTQFRHAETLDTRQAIRQEDKTGKQEGEEEEKDDGEAVDPWKDRTSISVSSLIVFLEQLVKQPGNQPQEKGGEDIRLSPQARPESEPERNDSAAAKANRAAQAYQRTYRATHYDASPAPPASGAIPQIALTPDEARQIHQLIDDLHALSKQRVSELTIYKSGSFLHSLIDAVEKVKNG